MHYKWSELIGGQPFSIVTMSGTCVQKLVEEANRIHQDSEFRKANFSILKFHDLQAHTGESLVLADSELCQLQIHFYDPAEAAIFKLKYL